MADLNIIGVYPVPSDQQNIYLMDPKYQEENIEVFDNGNNCNKYFANSSKKFIGVFDRSASKDAEGRDINDTLQVLLQPGEVYSARKLRNNETLVCIFDAKDMKNPKTQITCTGVECFEYKDYNGKVHMMRVDQPFTDEELDKMIKKSIQSYSQSHPPAILEFQI